VVIVVVTVRPAPGGKKPGIDVGRISEINEFLGVTGYARFVNFTGP
jgi:hypothetical protein